MGRIFQPARFSGASAPLSEQYPYTAGQVFLKGAVLIFDAGGNQGNVIEAAANPNNIVAVAEEAAGSRPGNQLSFDSSVVARTGSITIVNAAVANRVTIFSGRGVNGGTDPVVPAQTNVGVSYGILKTGAGEWVVNVADVVNTRVKVVDIDTTLNLFLFKFLESALAQP